MKTIKLKALRTNLTTAKYRPNNRKEPFDTSMCVEKEVDIMIEYGPIHFDDKPIVRVAEGAITGYESFYVEDLLRVPRSNGMTWCAGTPCSWDRLRTGPEETAKLMAALREEFKVV